MAALSILDPDGIITVCANPIYLTSKLDVRQGASITFEVLDDDASRLRKLVGQINTFGLDPKEPLFSAELNSLKPCRSTIPALSLLQKPVVRGTLRVLGPVNLKSRH